MKDRNTAKKYGAVLGTASALTLATVGTANAALDFTAITTAVDEGVAAVLLAITAVAVFKAGPGIAKWGYNKIIGWFR